jgi:hypothetical protein
MLLPFWSLNDRLEDCELEEQIESMKSVGLDGFFLHARGGLMTEYMSEDWFLRLETCIKKAHELGMQAWLYDENGWPSGSGNGEVTSKGIEFCQKILKKSYLRDCEVIPENILGFYRMTDGHFTVVDDPLPDDLVIYYVINPHYVDALSLDATQHFIQAVHETYYRRFQKYFDNGWIKGFFTDEPQYANGHDVWSEWIRKEWALRYGDGLISGLPLLFFDGEGCEEFRYRYYSIASHLLAHHFLKPIYDWCEAHNCQLTGHMMAENGLGYQIECTGGAMPCYEFFHMPGIDHLTRRIDNPILPRQLSSVAMQLNRPTLTETFGGCGWDVSLDELKWITQWQFVNGVTSICQHLQAYSLRGLRKRDWPPSLFIQSPWYGEAYKNFNDYFNRLSQLLSEGTEAANTLIIHPIKTGYMHYKFLDRKAVNEIDRAFANLITKISDCHLLYHFGDEEIIRNHACVRAERLWVGGCSYDRVVLPYLQTLNESTFEILLEFAKNGGQIYSVGAAPNRIEGIIDRRAEELSRLITIIGPDDIVAELPQTVSILTDGAENAQIHYTQRALEDGKTYYYFINLSDCMQTAKIYLDRYVNVSRYDVLSGANTSIDTWHEDGKTVFELVFAPHEDCVIQADNREISFHPADAKEHILVPLQNEMRVLECDDNCLTLDYCKYRLNDGQWSQELPVLQVQEQCMLFGRDSIVELEYSFFVEELSGIGNMDLAMEIPEKWEITINEKRYDFSLNGHFIDKSISRSSIFPFIKIGHNVIRLKGSFSQNQYAYQLYAGPKVHESLWNRLTLDTELESIYILGDFGVYSRDDYIPGERRAVFTGERFYIASRKHTVDIRNLTSQGYCFFSGKITLTQAVTVSKQKNTRYFIEISGLFAPAAKVLVNSREAGVFTFSPYRCDVTELIESGENEIGIVLFSGNRNTLGPHHLKEGESYTVSPQKFSAYKPIVVNGEEMPSPDWRRGYSFVIFGATFD